MIALTYSAVNGAILVAPLISLIGSLCILGGLAVYFQFEAASNKVPISRLLIYRGHQCIAYVRHQFDLLHERIFAASISQRFGAKLVKTDRWWKPWTVQGAPVDNILHHKRFFTKSGAGISYLWYFPIWVETTVDTPPNRCINKPSSC